jgi:hypothetical protein
MRLTEIQTPPTAYYLAANEKLGQTASRQDLKILPDGRHHLTESLLEKIRPANCLPRDTSIPLARSPEDLQALGHNAPRVYRVVPIGSPQWSDAQWVQRVRDAMELPVVDRPTCVEWAQAYWAGTPCPVGTPLWEGRARLVHVLQAVT